jgi:hypothetical protein
MAEEEHQGWCLLTPLTRKQNLPLAVGPRPALSAVLDMAALAAWSRAKAEAVQHMDEMVLPAEEDREHTDLLSRRVDCEIEDGPVLGDLPPPRQEILAQGALERCAAEGHGVLDRPDAGGRPVDRVSA